MHVRGGRVSPSSTQALSVRDKGEGERPVCQFDESVEATDKTGSGNKKRRVTNLLATTGNFGDTCRAF